MALPEPVLETSRPALGDVVPMPASLIDQNFESWLLTIKLTQGFRKDEVKYQLRSFSMQVKVMPVI